MRRVRRIGVGRAIGFRDVYQETKVRIWGYEVEGGCMELM
jgi:hypothetical protein